MRFAKVYLEITNVCNRSCAFCPGTRRAPAMLSVQEFEALAQKLVGYTRFLYFHVMGEPLLHPELSSFLAISERLGFRVILATNGTLLDQVGKTLLTAPALHKVNVSLHSFEANRADGFRDYLDGCIRFAEKAAEQGILVSLRLWNLDGQEVQGLHEMNGEILSRLEAHFPKPWMTSRDGQRLSDRVFLSWGARFDWPDLSAAEGTEHRFCYGLKDQLGVLCDGTVVPCCLDREGDVALGNLFKESLEEILQKPRTLALEEGFHRRRAVEPLCRRCGYSMRFSR